MSIWATQVTLRQSTLLFYQENRLSIAISLTGTSLQHNVFFASGLFLAWKSCKLSHMNTLLLATIEWIKNDWLSNRLRFCVEFVAWAISIGCSVTMALTVPNPPLLILYPVWIAGCAMYAWAAYSRQSFGMLANYLLLVTIDSMGFMRML